MDRKKFEIIPIFDFIRQSSTRILNKVIMYKQGCYALSNWRWMKKGTMCVRKEWCKAIYKMYFVGVRACAISKNYRIPQHSISTIIQHPNKGASIRYSIRFNEHTKLHFSAQVKKVHHKAMYDSINSLSKAFSKLTEFEWNFHTGSYTPRFVYEAMSQRSSQK